MNRKNFEKLINAEIAEEQYQRDFDKYLNEALAEKQAEAKKLYAEKVDRLDYTPEEGYVVTKPFKVAGDDKLRTGHWNELLRDSAFYYDQPTVDEKREIKRTLQKKHDSLFSGPWKAPLGSRHELL